jgi:tyrosine-protein kinase Etk/Wzc
MIENRYFPPSAPPAPALPPVPAQNDDEIKLHDLWMIARRNLGVIVLCLGIVMGAAVVYALRGTPVYEASTTIRIDEKQSNLPVLDVLKEISTGSELGTEMEVLRSRSLSEAVVDSLMLRLSLDQPTRTSRSTVFSSIRLPREGGEGMYTLGRMGPGRFSLAYEDGQKLAEVTVGEPFRVGDGVLTLSAAAADLEKIRFEVAPFARTVRNFSKTLAVTRPSRDANVVVVRYESTDPQLAREVPNVLAHSFIARRGVIKKSEARSTVEFLRGQIDTLTVQLAQAEDSLKNFRESARVVSLGEEATEQVKRLAQLQADRTALDAERSSLASLLAEAQSDAAKMREGDPSPYRRLLAFPTLLKNPATASLFQTLNDVENSRAELLVRRTPQDPDVVVLSDRIAEIEAQVHSIATTYLQGLTSQVASIDGQLGLFRSEIERVPAKEVQFARLARRPKVLEDIYSMLQSRLKEAEIVEAVDDPSVRVVDVAIIPDKPVRPNKPLVVVIGALLGLMLGAAVTFIREGMDRALHTREDVLRVAGVQVLALIPRIHGALGDGIPARQGLLGRLAGALGSGTNPHGMKRLPAPAASMNGQSLGARLVAGIDPHNPVSEAYRTLRTNVTFVRPGKPPKMLVFTSSMPGDGKSTTASNLAVTLAQQGTRVLLVDADMRRGVLNTVFGVPRDPGLSNLLYGGVELAEAIRPVDVGNGQIDFLATGIIPPNPAELLGSQAMHELLKRLEGEYDVIILDAPPVNVVTDAAVLGTVADGVILVTRAGVTTEADLQYAVEQINNVRAPILGAVLNDVDFKRDARYHSYATYASYTSFQGTEDVRSNGKSKVKL